MRMTRSFVAAVAVALAGCGAPEEIDGIEEDQLDVDAVDGKDDSYAQRFTYYSVRYDMRRCISPLCGGWWVKRVNQRYTLCAGGQWTDGECYVAEADLSRLGLGDEQTAEVRSGLAKMLVRGSIASKSFGPFGRLGQLLVTGAWKAATDHAPSGIVYLLTDSRVRCITTPCPTIKEEKLNSTAYARNVDGVDLKDSGATQKQIDAAFDAIFEGPGLLAAGVNVVRPGSGRVLDASQFWTKVVAPPKPQKKCFVGGCSSQVCSERSDVVTTCEFRPEYACYRTAKCELQLNGTCGWTKTPELSKCLAGAGH